MKTYFVSSNNISDLRDALGRMIEYAKFLEEESGRANDSFVDQIIEEDNIKLKVEEINDQAEEYL